MMSDGNPPLDLAKVEKKSRMLLLLLILLFLLLLLLLLLLLRCFLRLVVMQSNKINNLVFLGRKSKYACDDGYHP
jgi:hypothetical protein